VRPSVASWALCRRLGLAACAARAAKSRGPDRCMPGPTTNGPCSERSSGAVRVLSRTF